MKLAIVFCRYIDLHEMIILQIFLDESYDRGVENPGAKVDPTEAN